jgi:hypothetical protein
VTSRYSQQRNGRTVGPPTSLFPVAQSVDADTHGLCKLHLREANKTPQRSNVITRLEFTKDQPPASRSVH